MVIRASILLVAIGIFRTISHTLFHPLAVFAAYTQVRLLYIQIYNFTLKATKGHSRLLCQYLLLL